MNMTRIVTTSLVLLSFAAMPWLAADIVEISDGARLTGKIKGIADGVLTLETAYAGEIEIALGQVSTFTTDEDVAVRLASGDVLVGPVRSADDGQLEINTVGGTVSAATSSVAAGWATNGRDPAVVAREAELESLIRKWTYEAGLDIAGSHGNTERLTTSARFKAQLEGPTDRLQFNAIYEYAEEENEMTDHRAVGGLAFTSFFLDDLGWYVRQELEYNQPEAIDLRSTSAVGLTYRWKNEPRHKLETRAGVSFRHESYANGSSESFPGLEFGLTNYWQFAEWGEVTTDLAYLPSFNDFFGEYLATHDSGVNIPLGTSTAWVLRLGLENRYNSAPQTDRDKLDTTYYVRLILKWD